MIDAAERIAATEGFGAMTVRAVQAAARWARLVA